MYFDSSVVFVTSQTLFLRLAVAILWSHIKQSLAQFIFFLYLVFVILIKLNSKSVFSPFLAAGNSKLQKQAGRSN
jgi:hypothetical protein